MRKTFTALAAIAATTWVAAAMPASASPHEPSYGEHTGSVVFSEVLGDAAKRVGNERRPAPHADVDIRRVQFTQTDGFLTLDLDLRHLRAHAVDKLVVNFDTDGDAQPDQRMVWNGRSPAAALANLVGVLTTRSVRVLTTTVDCAPARVGRDIRHGRIHVVVDRDCFPVVPGDSGLHANVKHIQAMVYDRLGTVAAGSRPARAAWDFLGGQHAMVKVPF